MVKVEFLYNGIKTVIQCKREDKMKDIIHKFKEKANIGNNINIFYSYDGKVGLNEELSFVATANSEDKRRNKMNILTYENEKQKIIRNNDIIKSKEIINNDIIKSKNIICPECKENIKMDIKDYKISLFECKNKHKKENILLNEFEETM